MQVIRSFNPLSIRIAYIILPILLNLSLKKYLLLEIDAIKIKT
jgi:hypothetical protein